MIKIENVVLASPEQMEFIIEGMRNPMNSWEKSNSGYGCDSGLCSGHCAFSPEWCGNTQRYVLGENDHSLMQRLAKAGTDHRKFMRMMPVYVRITAPLYWWKEFTLEDFSCEHMDIASKTCLETIIGYLNLFRQNFLENHDKDIWWQMIQLLPSSYNQTRNVMLNYEVLANIYHSRKNHKLDEWRELCSWIETLPYSELITGEENNI